MTPAATSALAAGSLVVGFAVAAATGVRELGGLVLLVAVAVCAAAWRRLAGVPVAAGLVGLYLVAFAGSHLLARLVGAWPAVLLVAGAVGAASLVLTRVPARTS